MARSAQGSDRERPEPDRKDAKTVEVPYVDVEQHQHRADEADDGQELLEHQDSSSLTSERPLVRPFLPMPEVGLASPVHAAEGDDAGHDDEQDQHDTDQGWERSRGRHGATVAAYVW